MSNCRALRDVNPCRGLARFDNGSAATTAWVFGTSLKVAAWLSIRDSTN